MRLTRLLTAPIILLVSSTCARAAKILSSSSLNACSANSEFTASRFNVTFTPDDGVANFDVVITSSIEGKVQFDIAITAYGYKFFHDTMDPCKMGLAGLCPMTAGKIPFEFNYKIDKSALSKVPGIAYTVPDLDAKVRVYVNMTSTGESVACVEADVSNGTTVNLLGVKWATAAIIGLALLTSATLSGLGHANAAAHVAAHTLSLLGYFQTQAYIGMTSLPLPPIVQAWTQDFQWSMGIIHLSFMQRAFTWYQRATGGTAAQILSSLTTTSVQVAKRAVEPALSYGLGLLKRANIMTESGGYVVFGIQRVAFREKIETTNLFLTGLTFFCLLAIFTALGVLICKGVCDLMVKKAFLRHDQFLEFRTGWRVVLKGLWLRITLVGLTQMAVLCLWEFTQSDSPAIMFLAVLFLVTMFGIVGLATFKIITTARRSMAAHGNPAFILFSDPQTLNKWGFLYIQYRASAYYYLAPTVAYIFIKAAILAFSQQKDSLAPAIGFIILEAAALIASAVIKPWMDKSTNSFNIAICSVNFINTIILLVFTNVFDAPDLVVGVFGIVFFVLNAVFAFVLLMIIIITTTLIVLREQPELKYQMMDDDRTSFMRSQTALVPSTELDALGATARGDGRRPVSVGDDNMSLKGPPPSYRDPHQSQDYQKAPVSPSLGLFPVERDNSTHNSRQNYDNSLSPPGNFHSSQKPARPSSPWQRGAGYD